MQFVTLFCIILLLAYDARAGLVNPERRSKSLKVTENNVNNVARAFEHSTVSRDQSLQRFARRQKEAKAPGLVIRNPFNERDYFTDAEQKVNRKLALAIRYLLKDGDLVLCLGNSPAYVSLILQSYFSAHMS